MIFYIMAIIGILMICYGLRSPIINMFRTKKKGDERKMEKGTIGIVVIVVSALIFGLGWAAIAIGDMTGPAYKFNYAVHSHMENAYYSNEPTLMKSELLMAIDGMHELGLTDEMYGAYWGWDKVASMRMSYQYRHLNGIVERIDSVIQWRNEVYSSNSGQMPETLGDVYEQKMDNLREFLNDECWSDWIAHDAFYANFHLFYFLSGLIILILIIQFLIFLIIGWLIFTTN